MVSFDGFKFYWIQHDFYFVSYGPHLGQYTLWLTTWHLMCAFALKHQDGGSENAHTDVTYSLANITVAVSILDKVSLRIKSYMSHFIHKW